MIFGTQGNPALVPTVMAAYASTSFLSGVIFILLGALRPGDLVRTILLLSFD